MSPPRACSPNYGTVNVEQASLIRVADGSDEAHRSDTTTQPSNEVDVSPMNAKYSKREHIFIVLLATLLAFNSGFSNGVCLSGLVAPPKAGIRSQSTSGYTGVYSSSALALADSMYEAQSKTLSVPNVEYFGFEISMILSFVVGTTITGLLNPRPSPWRMAPMYAPTFLIGAILMCLAAILASISEHMEDSSNNRFFFLVAMANGVQNGVSSMYSANLIRTTHMSGTTSDIGLFLGQVIRGNTTNLWKLQILIALAVSFWFGSFSSMYFVREWEGCTLLFNAAIFLLIFALIVGFLVKNLHLPVHMALQGTWHWQRALHGLGLRCGVDGKPMDEEKLIAVFEAMDIDGDGSVDVDEFCMGLENSGVNIPRPIAEHMFHVCDRDLSGRICKSEWISLVQGDNILVG